jgi:hypothetical protein
MTRCERDLRRLAAALAGGSIAWSAALAARRADRRARNHFTHAVRRMRQAIAKFVAKQTSRLEREIEALKDQSGSVPRHLAAGGTYEQGSMAIRRGSLWIAKEITASAPGTDATWQLCVKSGNLSERDPAIA